MQMTYSIAMAAARDAGNRHMRAAGRTVWAVVDWNHACETFKRLWPERVTPIPEPHKPQESGAWQGLGRLRRF